MTQAYLPSFSDELAATADRIRGSTVQVRAGRGGIGSGIIWRVGAPDANGESEATVITNAHVVRAGSDSTFTLGLADGRAIPATVVAVDPEHDLAALTTRAANVGAVEIGDSSALRVGELVIAVGNPWGREGAVTVGVVAARAPADPSIELEPADPESAPDTAERRDDRPDQRERRGPRGEGFGWPARRPDVIQADIRLYPGNSGGPLADARGRVVGVNAMVGGGLGFAIPSRSVQQFLSDAERGGRRGYLGVAVVPALIQATVRARLGLQQEAGILVAGVEAGGPAEAAGVMIGDLLLALDGYTIRDVESLSRALSRTGDGGARTLVVVRGGERVELALTPVARAA